MNISNKLKTILSLQSILVKMKNISKNVQKVFDAGESKDQWNAYCLKTGEHFDLPEGMTEIPEYMFYKKENVKSVSIPETVTIIGSSAFSYSSVNPRQIPEGITALHPYAFDHCTCTDVVIIPSTIKEIYAMVFRGNTELTEVTFVKTSTQSGKPSLFPDTTFWLCDKLKTINVPWSEGEVAGAPWGAENATINYNFWDTAITSEVFTFPQGFIKIPDYLFYDTTATSAKEIYLGDECEEIGEAAFYRASNLETVHLPDGLKKIGAYGFRYCSALELSELPDSVEEIGNRAFHGSSISLNKLPKNIKTIRTNAFQNCSDNVFTEIPESVSLIAANAFLNNTGLTELTFVGTPMVKKVTNGIANNAFAGCTNLKTIKVPWSEGEVSGAPWGAENATIIYDWKEE